MSLLQYQCFLYSVKLSRLFLETQRWCVFSEAERRLALNGRDIKEERKANISGVVCLFVIAHTTVKALYLKHFYPQADL